MVHREIETAFDTLHGRSERSSLSGHDSVEDKGTVAAGAAGQGEYDLLAHVAPKV